MEQLRRRCPGDVYEHLLLKLKTAGTNGQFRTPRHIIKNDGRNDGSKADDLICDPACGTSGFLVESSEYLRKEKAEVLFNAKTREHYMNHMFHGYDMDRNDAAYRSNEHDDTRCQQSEYRISRQSFRPERR